MKGDKMDDALPVEGPSLPPVLNRSQKRRMNNETQEQNTKHRKNQADSPPTIKLLMFIKKENIEGKLIMIASEIVTPFLASILSKIKPNYYHQTLLEDLKNLNEELVTLHGKLDKLITQNEGDGCGKS